MATIAKKAIKPIKTETLVVKNDDANRPADIHTNRPIAALSSFFISSVFIYII